MSYATANATIVISSIQGGYTIRSGELALKLLILDSNVNHLPYNISYFFPNVQFFGVVDSKLEFFKRENFNGMEAMKTLILKRNKISQVPDEVFVDLINLRKIDLSENLIVILPSNAFNSMFHLTKFIANENSIELFDSDIFRHNHKLDEIHLWHNKIKAIRFDIKKIMKLAIFDLRENVCIDKLFYLSSQTPSSPMLQVAINRNCSSYVKQQGLLMFKRSNSIL